MELREFGGFKREWRAMAAWVASFDLQEVVMESTGICWKSPYAALGRRVCLPCRPWSHGLMNGPRGKVARGRPACGSCHRWVRP
jgi:hypothetical protein